ncbi:hypothetical protein SVAN01_01509 [Stagonosporopsis vannaccii]|nr:hypothetical protein SVAN01_01509 [Stagonosporopsis vannaccii]
MASRVERPKRMPGRPELTFIPVNTMTFPPVTESQISPSRPSSESTASNTIMSATSKLSSHVVFIKAAVCTKCGFHEEAEEDLVMLHCVTETEMNNIALPYRDLLSSPARGQEKALSAKV